MKNIFSFLLIVALLVTGSCTMKLPQESDMPSWTINLEIPLMETTVTAADLLEDSTFVGVPWGTSGDSIFAYQDETEIEKVEGRIKEIQEELSAKKDQLKETKKERRVKEVRIQEIDELLQKHEEEKYRVKSKNEFEALEREIAALEKEKDKEEDFLLELMEKEDELTNLLPTLERNFALEKEKLTQQRAKLDQEVAALDIKEEGLGKEREKVASQISRVYYQQYEQLRKLRDGLAVVMIKDGVCGGCNVKISPSLIGQARRQQVVYCENCNRIIYIG